MRRDFKPLRAGFQQLLGAKAGVHVAAFGRLADYSAPLPAGTPSEVPAVSSRRGGGSGQGATDPTEPLARNLALPVSSVAPAAPPRGNGAPALDLTALDAAVRRVSWGGDRQRGTARLELGGVHAGTAVTIRGDGDAVSVRIELGHGCPADGLPERLRERLEARGLRVTEFEVA